MDQNPEQELVMADKLELEIVALSHSITQSHSYAVVLGEKEGRRRLPVVIGGAEAQSIAVALEKMTPSRPLTHDLIKNMFDKFEMQLKEVLISNLQDGIFYAQLICEKDGETYEIDSRTSDAIALAVRFDCPVFSYEFIMDSAGIIMEEEGEEGQREAEEAQAKQPQESGTENFSQLSQEELNNKLNEALEREEYEKAIKIRDELNRRQESS